MFAIEGWDLCVTLSVLVQNGYSDNRHAGITEHRLPYNV